MRSFSEPGLRFEIVNLILLAVSLDPAERSLSGGGQSLADSIASLPTRRRSSSATLDSDRIQPSLYPHVDVAHTRPRPASPSLSPVPHARLGRPGPHPLSERRLQAGRPRGQQHRRRQEWLPQDEDDELRPRKGIQTQRCVFLLSLSPLVLSLREGRVV